MTKHKHDNTPSTAALAYQKLGSIVFLCGFLVGAIGAGGLLFAEMTKMNKSLLVIKNKLPVAYFLVFSFKSMFFSFIN